MRRWHIIFFICAVLTGAVTFLLFFSTPDSARAAPRAEAYVAGGCFWCVEADFEKLPGVYEVISGYAGGQGENPTYENHSRRGYIEAARILYNPREISYQQLLAHFMTTIDPLDGGGQFCDRGHSYTTAVFYQTAPEKKIARQALEKTARILGQKPATRLVPLTRFWKAEAYHQDYYKKNPLRYRYYRSRCGRDDRLQEVWKGRKLQLP